MQKQHDAPTETNLASDPEHDEKKTVADEHWTDGTDGPANDSFPVGTEYCGVEIDPLPGLDD